MSNVNAQPKSGVSSVENVVSHLIDGELPIKSVTVIRDVVAGVILGEVDEVDHEMELAAGVSYVVIGLGKLPTNFEPGINFVELKK